MMLLLCRGAIESGSRDAVEKWRAGHNGGQVVNHVIEVLYVSSIGAFYVAIFITLPLKSVQVPAITNDFP
jgi:hypothetical protein